MRTARLLTVYRSIPCILGGLPTPLVCRPPWRQTPLVMRPVTHAGKPTPLPSGQKEWHTLVKQECIPVGCVPAARCPYAEVCFRGGGCLPGGGSAPGGCLVWGGGSAWSGGCLLLGGLPGGGSAWSRGVCLFWRSISQHVLRQTPIPPDQADPPCGQTDACENITLAQLRCGR